MKAARLALAGAVVIFIAAAAGLWSFFTGAPEVNVAAGPGEVRWRAKVGRDTYWPAATGDTAVCFARSVWTLGYARLVARDLETGRRLWTRKTALVGRTSFMSMAGKPLVLNLEEYGGRIEAYDAHTGEVAWRCPLDRPDPSDVLKRDENTVIVYGYRAMHAVELDPARPGWSISNTGVATNVSSVIALDGGKAFFATWQKELRAADIVAGQTVWTADLGGVAGAVAAGSGTVCVIIQGANELKAFDAADGSPRWDAGKTVWNSAGIAVDSGRVFVADATSLVCLSLADGREVWATSFNMSRAAVWISVSGSTVYCGSDGMLAAFDAATGAKRWHCAIEGVAQGAPAVARDTVCVATSAGWLYAVAAEPEGEGQ